MRPTTMKLSEYCSKLVYQREVNTGYREGFLGRIEHDPIRAYSTPRNNKFTSGVQGLDLSFDDHVSRKEVIEKAMPDVFKDITLMYEGQEIITDEIKKQFINRFWNRRLGKITASQFQETLEYYFMIECREALIQNYLLSTITIQDLIDGGSQSSNSDSDTFNGSKTTPDGSTLSINNSKTMLLDRADMATRGIGSSNGSQSSKLAKYQAYLLAERHSNIDTIMTGARKLFILIG